MISDKERREVAELLRNGGFARDSEEAYVLLLSRIGIRPQLPATNTYEDAMARLAGLIDPTCEAVEYGRPDESHVCKGCSKCSYGWVEDINDKPYSFCPNCGARVKGSNSMPLEGDGR